MKIHSAVFVCLLLSNSWLSANTTALQEIAEGFAAPPVDCRPHTRWWWMGNALQKDDIVRQLDEMKAQGIGGVEQITMPPVYEKGNRDYLSPEYFDLLRFSVEQARERGLEYSLNFGGPGWIWGGKWVPKEDQSKILLASMMELDGPRTYAGPLPLQAALNPSDHPRSTPVIAAEDRLLAVVAARMEAGRLRAESLTQLTADARREVAWNVPEGHWQLMAFWITQRDNADAVDHLSEGAMRRYCDTLGDKYAAAIGEHFGKTVESFFSDSFEVPIFRNGLYWSDGLLDAFRRDMGYDLGPWLPALWWEVDDLSDKIRHDVNAFLHRQGMKAFFGPFTDWCKRHNVRARIQPYGFVTDVLEGAGASDIPEMEITPGEKDAVPWFDTRIGPREYVASGAHLYGRQIVSVEAFTFLHHEPYRETLQELKIATDGFLRAGANKFYNHGFIASPEHDIVPTRGFFEAIRISPENIWWPYYHHLAQYTARCCWLLRQGEFAADVAVYSPLANQWAVEVLNARRWTRDFDWGDLNALLSTNGYAFDLVNDDTLQRHARFDGATLHAGAMSYRVLLLPDVGVIPLASYRQMEAFVRQGGSIIALERTPEAATGFQDHAAGDDEVQRLSAALFGAPANPDDNAMREYGRGRTYFLQTVIHRDDPLDLRSAAFDPFVKTLRQCVPPDMETDIASAGKRTNDGLVFTHRRAQALDIYFVANLHDEAVTRAVGLRAAKGRPECWDPHTGRRAPIHSYSHDGDYTRLALSMEPYESRFICFDQSRAAHEEPHVLRSDFDEIVEATPQGFTALAARNGRHGYQFFDGAGVHTDSVTVEDVPGVYDVNGEWRVRFTGTGAPADEYVWPRLVSWTDVAAVRHFSGKGHYALAFDLPEDYTGKDRCLKLSLGRVGTVAEIRLNGQAVGVHWMEGQTFDVGGLVRPGRNELQVDLTNTLINRVSGMQQFPELAEELKPLYGKGVNPPGRRALSLLGFEPLPPSGLLGPVRLVPYKRVTASNRPPLAAIRVRKVMA